MSGIFSVHRVVADSSGTSATQADGSPTQIAALARYLAAGDAHTCGVLNGGELKCFGVNTAGQIGSGGTVALGDAAGEMDDALVAVNLGAGRSVRAVSAGSVHTCALLDNDAVKCWGAYDDGQLGLGDIDARGDAAGEMGDALPAVSLGLAAGVRVVAIAAGDAHTCVVLSSGAVKCWGAGANGRLGSGNEHSRGDNAGEMGASLPTIDVGAGRTAKAISVGAAHTCVIRDLNDVVC